MRVLLTGSAGYIGTVLAPALKAAGHDVVGLDTGLYQGSHFGDLESLEPTLDLDVRDVQRQHLEGFDAVIHLAGLSNDPLGEYRPELTDEINHLATVRLARLARQAGVQRFLFASSCSNYGSAGDEFIDEQGLFRPITPYAKSKVDAESGLRELADETFSPIYLRAATAYGYSPMLRFDLVLNNLMAWAFTSKRVHIKSDGTPWRPIAHVQDIAAAYVAALHAPLTRVHDRAFNVGASSENYRVSELASIVAETVTGSVLDYAEGAGPDTRCYRVDCNRIATELEGYKPQWTARRGAAELFSAFQQHGLELDEVEGARYSRIEHISKLVGEGKLSADLRWNSAGR